MGGKGGGGSKKVTVGYRYSWDVQSGLGRGAVNEIVAISADNKTVFAGTPGQINRSMSVYIDKPNVFGGDDTGGEGGIRGTLEIAMGDPDQVPTPLVRRLLKGDVPGFRGIVTTFFSGLVSCYSATPKPWKYRVRRSDKGWDGAVWYPEKLLIKLRNDDSPLPDEGSLSDSQKTNLRDIHAINPAHILVQCATDRDWGRGLTLDRLDLASYQQVADTLHREGFGLCLRYNRQTDLDVFIGQILDHIGGVQYGDLSTGKLVLKLLRNDYDPETLPVYTYDTGIIGVQDDDSTSADAAPNELVVTYRCPVLNEDKTVKAHNLGAIQSVGLISSSREYKGIPTHSLAVRVAERDLEVGVSGLARLVLNFDRRGSALMPATVFRINLPDRGVNNMVVRVGGIEENSDGSYKITVIQDVFGLPSTSYSSGDEGGISTEPDLTAQPVTNYQLFEIPYALLVSYVGSNDLDALSPFASYLSVAAMAPSTTSLSYLLQTGHGQSWQTVSECDWHAGGELLSHVGALDTRLSVQLNKVPPIGIAALLGEEVIRIDDVDIETNTLTVGRGCADTLPQSHAAGTELRLFIDGLEGAYQEYLETESLCVRLLTKTTQNTLNPECAVVDKFTFTGRQSRPYLPGRIAVNEVIYPTKVQVADEYELSWAHRDRLLQLDRLVDCLADSIGAEPGTQYHASLTLVGETSPVWSISTANNSVTLPYSTKIGGCIHELKLWCSRDDRDSHAVFSVKLPEGKIVELEVEESEIKVEEND